MADPVFAPGDRVATNELYAKTFPRMKQQTGGVIVPLKRQMRLYSSKRCYVLWDGHTKARPFHASFLKREGEDG